MDERIDVVVVGGGSAGCVIAARLSEEPERSVLLMEAGPDYGPFADGGWPEDILDAGSAADATHDWGFRDLSATRARVIGGCSSHNECVVAWAPPNDYRGWARSGDHRWSFGEQRPLLARAERMLETRTAPTRPLEAAFLRAVEEVGLPVLEDMNSDPWHPGAAVLPMNVVDGARWSTAFAYLDAARGRRNLTIRADTIVDRVTFSGTAASGIIGRRDGAAEAWRAGTVVVCAGTYMTPAILQRSGIGPGPVLERLGIEPIVDLPGVGDHLRDHPMLDVSFIARDAAVHDGLQHVVLKSRSPLCRDEHWDTHVLLFAWRPGDGRPDQVIFSVAAVESDSSGHVALRSADPGVLPEIQQPFAALSDHDLSLLAEGTSVARRLASSQAFVPFVGEEVSPGSADDQHDRIRADVAGYWHPVGTCRMGPPEDRSTVVSPTGRVHGTEGLIVADASIFPTTPRANTNLPTIAIAEMIASTI
jgi:choline dehydrogenase